jgi:hypothetical protein
MKKHMEHSIVAEHFFRYPIKSISREELRSLNLEKDKAIPFDREWALVHENSSFDHFLKIWQPCGKFLRGSILPSLSAVNSKNLGEENCYEFSHPELSPISLNLSKEEDRDTFVNWVTPICSDKLPKPSKLVNVPNTALTDTPFQSISINSLDSLEDLSRKMKMNLNLGRFRGNIWIRTGEPWVEFAWTNKTIKINDIELKVVSPIERCNATKTDPFTGRPNGDTLTALLENYGHQDFGIYCSVIKGGKISKGDKFKLVD